MTFRMMTAAAFAVATLAAPAMAQMTGSGSMGSGSTHGTGMQGAPMASDDMRDHRTMAPAHPMTRAQMASMRRCHAMSHARMMRSGTCMKLQRMHDDAMAPHTM